MSSFKKTSVERGHGAVCYVIGNEVYSRKAQGCRVGRSDVVKRQTVKHRTGVALRPSKNIGVMKEKNMARLSCGRRGMCKSSRTSTWGLNGAWYSAVATCLDWDLVGKF